MEGEPPVAAPANNRIIINTRGWPTDDKPSVTLETPPDPSRTSRRRARWPSSTSRPQRSHPSRPGACLAIPEASGKPGWPPVLHRGRTPGPKIRPRRGARQRPRRDC